MGSGSIVCGRRTMVAMRRFTAVVLACVVLVAAHGEAVEELSAEQAIDTAGPVGGQEVNLGEADGDDDDSLASTKQSGAKQEAHDEREVEREANQDIVQGVDSQGQSDLGEGAGSAKGDFTSNIFVTSKKQRLRVGSAWNMPGLYASDGQKRDLILGTAGGKKIYFGIAKNDAWIQSATGHMWLKGSMTVKNFGHFFAEGQRLRVGAVWGMPGIYASDGGVNRDLMLGTAAGKKIYFGIKKKDAWIQAGTGNMYLKGKLEANLNSHFKAGGKTLRVGSAWNMPGLYASDGGADDLMLGTTSGRRIYFGVDKLNAWIQAGTGHMWLKGSLTAENNGYFVAEKQKLRVGSVWGMPGLYASDGEARDLVLGTKKGRKVYIGSHKTDVYITAGTGDAHFNGQISTKQNALIEVAGQKLRVGQYAGMPGIYSSEGAPRDLILGAATDRKVYIGSSTSDAYFTAGAGSLYLKGSMEAHKSIYVYAEKQRLRVGAIHGIPGVHSSDGAARDLMLGTAKNKKVFFGWAREDAWLQAGTGESYFKGKMSVADNIVVSKKGQTIRVGEAFGMPGIYSSEGSARDLMLGAASGKKVFLGFGRDNAYVESGTGNAWFKGTLAANNMVAKMGLKVNKAAFFEDTVTVKKNLILQQSETESMDLMKEMQMMKTENAELRSMMAEMRSQMAEMRAA